jgi:hypothetical protein
VTILDHLSEWLVAFALFLGVFILSRRVWTWYFKIDKIEKHLAEIAAALRPAERRNDAGRLQRPPST